MRNSTNLFQQRSEEIRVAATRECSTQEPEEAGNFDAGKKTENVYQCDADHSCFDASGSKAKCGSAAECTGYLFGEGDAKQCISRAQCARRQATSCTRTTTTARESA